MAQGWAVAGLTTSAFTLGLINFCAGIPMLALTMRGGIVADRYDKRRILIITQALQIILALRMCWLIANGHITDWHVVVAGGLVGISTASAFYAIAVSFLALIIAILTLRPRPPGTEEEEAMRKTGIKDGFDYVCCDKPTLAMISMLTTLTTCVSPFFMITISLYSRHVLHVDAQSHGFLIASSGIGAFVGSIYIY
jgi:predicted MFS family arabinose efflux permease